MKSFHWYFKLGYCILFGCRDWEKNHGKAGDRTKEGTARATDMEGPVVEVTQAR